MLHAPARLVCCSKDGCVFQGQQLAFPDFEVEQTCYIRQKPADGNRPPDTHHADGGDGGKKIRQRHPGAKGNALLDCFQNVSNRGLGFRKL